MVLNELIGRTMNEIHKLKMKNLYWFDRVSLEKILIHSIEGEGGMSKGVAPKVKPPSGQRLEFRDFDYRIEGSRY